MHIVVVRQVEALWGAMKWMEDRMEALDTDHREEIEQAAQVAAQITTRASIWHTFSTSEGHSERMLNTPLRRSASSSLIARRSSTLTQIGPAEGGMLLCPRFHPKGSLRWAGKRSHTFG